MKRNITDDEFDQIVLDLMVEDIQAYGPRWFAHMVYTNPGSYEAMREEYNNQALRRWEEEHEPMEEEGSIGAK
jgi:hypothetical protein